jgi:hypothetical protein
LQWNATPPGWPLQRLVAFAGGPKCKIEVAMSETIEHMYPTVEMTKVGRIMKKLHEQVVHQRHRVEITRAGCEDCCIMISRAELESLESALAIFADTAAFNEMCDHLKTLLKSAGLVYTAPTYGDAEQLRA